MNANCLSPPPDKSVYIWVILVRGNIQQKCYIPTKFAKKNKVLKIKNDSGQWEDGWQVTVVFPYNTISEPPNIRKAVKEHRKRTGDAEKKQ